MRVTYHQLLCAEKKLLYCFTLASAVIFARKKRDIHVWKATHWGLHIEMHLAMSPLKKFHALLLASSDHHETDWWQAMKCLVVGREGSRYENWSKSAVLLLVGSDTFLGPLAPSLTSLLASPIPWNPSWKVVYWCKPTWRHIQIFAHCCPISPSALSFEGKGNKAGGDGASLEIQRIGKNDLGYPLTFREQRRGQK